MIVRRIIRDVLAPQYRFWLFAVLLPVLFLSLWSYVMINGNLTLIAHPWMVAWQTWWWEKQSDIWWRTLGYAIPVALWWLWYGRISRDGSKMYAWLQTRRGAFWVIGVVSVITAVLLSGHNALSYDIYNYLFNAKMITVYGANPHVKTALDFAYDPWVRFMHNIHTPAPYAYGWTAFSLIPFVLSGIGSLGFLVSYYVMRLWMVLGFGMWAYALWLAVHAVWSTPKQARLAWALGVLQPLVLIETVLNGHNDLWMMAPALMAFVLVLRWPKRGLALFGAGILLIFSIAMKYVTIVLAPLFVALLIEAYWPKMLKQWLKRLRLNWALPSKIWPELAVLGLMVPLLTLRSQQFHPWYFLWVLTFWPLVRTKWMQFVILSLAISSSFRYLPWLWGNLEYTPAILVQQKIVTWSGVIFGLLSWLVCEKPYRRLVIRFRK